MTFFTPSVYKRQASAPASFGTARNDCPADSQERATSNRSPTQRTSCFLASPLTPEGLLPRKSPDSLRTWKLGKPQNSSREFLPCRRSEWEEQLPGVSGILEDMESNLTTQRSSNNHNGDDDDDDDDNDMIIPPPQYLQNKPTFDSSLMSPQVPTSSFYARKSSMAEGPVAMSPVLTTGQARTAVGALVALREAGNENLETNGISYRDICTTSITDSKKEPNLPQLDQSFAMSVLPPRTKNTERRSEREDARSGTDSDTENIFKLPSTREKCMASGINNREDLCRLPPPSSVQLQNRHHIPVSKSPVLGAENTTLESTSHPSQVLLKKELSKVAGSKTTVRDQQTQLDLDGNQDSYDQTLMKRKFANQKVRKQMMRNSIYEKESDGVLDEGKGKKKVNCGNDEESHEMHLRGSIFYGTSSESSYIHTDGTMISTGEALQRRKQQSQRLEKEKIVLEVVARLRDNLDLVHDIEASCCTKSHPNAENLLAGFSVQTRNRLLSSIDSILSEMHVIEPENLMVSPSKAQILSTSHNSLKQALCFCRLLVFDAIPQHEKERMVKKL